jgi:hypothetical protein
VFDFVEEALDEIALAIEHEITSTLHFAVGLWRDHRNDCALIECRKPCRRAACKPMPIINFFFPVLRFLEPAFDQYCLPIFSFLINVPPCRKVFAE